MSTAIAAVSGPGVALLLASVAATAAEGTSVHPACGTFRGRATVEHHYGPPNYGEDPTTDARMRVVILTFPRPLRARVFGPEPKYDADVYVTRLQVLFRIGDPRASVPYRGQTAAFSGCLVQAESGHHVTPVLLDTIGPPPQR